jgi:hypothetical protein
MPVVMRPKFGGIDFASLTPHLAGWWKPSVASVILPGKDAVSN